MRTEKRVENKPNFTHTLHGSNGLAIAFQAVRGVGNLNIMNVELNGRQAMVCERAIEMISMGHWSELQQDVKDFSGKELTEDEIETIKSKLRGDE